MLRRWERWKQKFEERIKEFKIHNSFIHSNEGRTLENSGFQIFYDSNSTFINSFDKTKFLLHIVFMQLPYKTYSSPDLSPNFLFKLQNHIYSVLKVSNTLYSTWCKCDKVPLKL